jgi:rubrerythrin
VSSSQETAEATRRELIARGLALAGTRSDRGALRAMMRAEQALVFTYEQVLAAGVLPERPLRIATAFLEHERAHIRALEQELARTGGLPPRRPTGFGPLGALTADLAVTLLLDLERAALSVYYTELASIRDPRIARVAAAIMGNEAQHASELRELLSPGDVSRAVPGPFVFGTR